MIQPLPVLYGEGEEGGEEEEGGGGSKGRRAPEHCRLTWQMSHHLSSGSCGFKDCGDKGHFGGIESQLSTSYPLWEDEVNRREGRGESGWAESRESWRWEGRTETGDTVQLG